ncbi:DUF6000 family protein [Streptomyces xanthochromogenes]|uniref:DUF6000 family protein n=1 Tax=Streptomyces xanthochromogenes TaxID=67384 RepID=UPI003420B523
MSARSTIPSRHKTSPGGGCVESVSEPCLNLQPFLILTDISRHLRPATLRALTDIRSSFSPTQPGAAYCVAFAKFGTAADAELLSAYLDHYLSRPDLDYDQAVVLGTLLYLDEILGSEYTTRFLAPAGPWDRWLEVRAVAALAPHGCRQAVQQLCAFVDETAEVFASLGCGS